MPEQSPEIKKIIADLRASKGWAEPDPKVLARDKEIARQKELKRIKTRPVVSRGGGLIGPFNMKNK